MMPASSAGPAMRSAVPTPDAGSPNAALALLIKLSLKSEFIVARIVWLISSSVMFE
jgi:hypothetical protein